MDIDCWSAVYGHPLQPGMIHNVILERLTAMGKTVDDGGNA
jgi:2-oxoglutarate ferredoxin oxidoreductase subunit alpha